MCDRMFRRWEEECRSGEEPREKYALLKRPVCTLVPEILTQLQHGFAGLFAARGVNRLVCLSSPSGGKALARSCCLYL